MFPAWTLALEPILAPSTWYTDTVYTCANGDDPTAVVNFYNPSGTSVLTSDPTTLCDTGSYFNTGDYPDAAAWLANFNPGVYGTYHLVQYAAASDCNTLYTNDYDGCIGTAAYDSDQAVLFVNSVDPGPPSPDIPLGGATSTIEQTQQNLSTAMIIFLVSFFGMLWILRKH